MFRTFCNKWEDGVALFFNFYPILQKNKETRALSFPLVSAIGTLIDVFSNITSNICHHTFLLSSVELRLKWKQLLSNTVDIFVRIVYQTQRLRQHHEENHIKAKEWASFVFIIQERKDLFCACCHLLCQQNSGSGSNLSSVDDKVIRQLKMMLEEIACDEEEVEEIRTRSKI